MPTIFILIIICISIFPNSENAYLANNLIKYENAFRYIEENKGKISEFYKEIEPDSIILKVSDQVITYCPKFFINEIMQKEFCDIPDSTKSKITDILASFPEPSFTGVKNKEFSEMSRYNKYNFVLFFSQKADDKIIADVRFYRKDLGINFTDYNDSYTGCNILFLFWFKNTDEIDKVVYKRVCK